MIGKLKGQVDSVGEEECLLDVHGVVYLVSCGSGTLRKMVVGEAVILHIETYVRQDMIRMFGFLTEEERAWFIRLQSIQGVGAKSALSVLDILPPRDLMHVAEIEDISAVAQAQGIGKKIAQRIVTELKGKGAPKTRSVLGMEAIQPMPLPSGTLEEKEGEKNAYQLRQDAISALVHLGFQEAQVRSVISSLQTLEDPETGLLRQYDSVDALIKAALKALAP